MMNKIIKTVNKDRIVISDISFCLGFQYGCSRHNLPTRHTLPPVLSAILFFFLQTP